VKNTNDFEQKKKAKPPNNWAALSQSESDGSSREGGRGLDAGRLTKKCTTPGALLGEEGDSKMSGQQDISKMGGG